MYVLAVLVLSFLRLLLVEGAETSSELPSVKSNAGSDTDSERRILYGESSRVKDFPYLAQIKRSSKAVGCAGAIIANHWVITAAHCLLGEPCGGILVIPSASFGINRFRSLHCYPHPRSHSEKFEHDIGLIKVSEDLLEDNRIKTVKLPPPGEVYPPGKPFVISGWGLTEARGLRGLKTATIPLISWESCNRQFHELSMSRNMDIPRRVFCLQGDGPKPPSVCYGDSGGPAVTNNGVLAGVAAISLKKNDACIVGGPSIFMNVVDYLPWIYEHIDPNRDTSNYPVRPERDEPKKTRG